MYCLFVHHKICDPDEEDAAWSMERKLILLQACLNLIQYLDVLINCLYKKIKEHKLIEPKKEEERNIKKKMRKQLVAEDMYTLRGEAGQRYMLTLACKRRRKNL